jgi:hypothetical protein
VKRLKFFAYLDDENGSVRRARETECHIAELETGGPYVVTFEDSEGYHEVLLHGEGSEWVGDCYDLDEDNERVQRCRGFQFNRGPCAHLYAVWNRLGRDEIDVEADSGADAARADGGRSIDRVFGYPEGRL